ncbi:hypothetical protein ACERK3_08360 [Phycisphaerales bacterium AB-hyl4]|uniref:Lipoprotein n=1 Tax=Natronomicrosphaera hydrolytica TaxID=3242702 RepID=A0ABV4U3X6_9BACT
MKHRRWVIPCSATVMMAVILLTGCQDPLFPTDAPRTPYDRYRTLRGEERPMTDEMARGTPRSGRPALRERLRPLDQY